MADTRNGTVDKLRNALGGKVWPSVTIHKTFLGFFFQKRRDGRKSLKMSILALSNKWMLPNTINRPNVSRWGQFADIVYGLGQKRL